MFNDGIKDLQHRRDIEQLNYIIENLRKEVQTWKDLYKEEVQYWRDLYKEELKKHYL